jgi:FecR protein
MYYINYKLILISFFIGIFASCNSFAAESIEIVRASGKVVIKQEDQKERPVGFRSILPAKHTLITGPDGRVVIRVGEAGYIVVEKNSTIEIDHVKDRANFFRQITGMIYYAMNALRPSQPPLEVRMTMATLGIRGTRFLVADLPDRKEIGMRKGLISVTSPDKDFEIHRKAEQDEFEAFKREGQDAIAKEKREFEEYKAKSEREFVEYKREFTLGANRMVTFDGKRVDDRPLSGETQKDMESLEAYGKEWIEEVRD